MQADSTDSASLDFESILEGDISQGSSGSGGGGCGGGNTGDGGTSASGNHDMAVAGTSASCSASTGVDHHFLFDIQRDNYDIPRNNSSMASYENTDLDIDIDIERKKREFSHKYPNYSQAKNELSDNALFNKFRDAADGCTIVSSSSQPSSTPIVTTTPNRPIINQNRDNNVNDDNGNQHDDDDDNDDDVDVEDDDIDAAEGKLKDSNSVSCEDLLEFANRKPKGKERGIESDEVRIMTKVLGSNVSITH